MPYPCLPYMISASIHVHSCYLPLWHVLNGVYAAPSTQHISYVEKKKTHNNPILYRLNAQQTNAHTIRIVLDAEGEFVQMN